MVAAVVIAGAILLGMAAAAGYAARTLPSGAEQSARFVLLPGVMLVVLAAEASALIVAKRGAASPDAGSPAAASPEIRFTDTPGYPRGSNLDAISYWHEPGFVAR